MTIAEVITRMMDEKPSWKDFLTFLAMRARGNVLHLGMCEEGRGITALLYGVERNGGHVWSANPFPPECLSVPPFVEHQQWTLIECDALDVEFIRTGGVPEEIDLLYINAEPNKLDTTLVLKSWGNRVKTNGVIVVSGVKEKTGVQEACEDYAKSYGMMFRVRQSEADLGVIFYPDNKEAL